MPVIEIPIELKKEFDKNPVRAMRVYTHHSVRAVHPFFPDLDRIKKCVVHDNPFKEETLTFDPSFICADPKIGYYLHTDLALGRKDSAGLAMAHVSHFMTKASLGASAEKLPWLRDESLLPFVCVDFMAKIRAKKGQEVQFSDIREIVYELRRRGFNIELVTYDRWQSVDSVQILRAAGFIVSFLSIDRTVSRIIVDYDAKNQFIEETTKGRYSAAWQCLKDALTDERLHVCQHPDWVDECKGTEEILGRTRKPIDHAPGYSNDMLQAAVGAVYNAINNESVREVITETPEERMQMRQEEEFYEVLDTPAEEYIDSSSSYDDDSLVRDLGFGL